MRNISFSPPDVGQNEINEVIEVLNSGWITTGPKTKKFEEKIAEYCSVNRAVCLNSATACLESILRLMNIGPGDEVITSAYTYTATASPVCHVGARLVLVDVAVDSYEMDYEQLENAITEKTKAIIAVDLGGVMCDYERLFEIVERKKNIYQPSNKIQEAIGHAVIIADSAHAFGARSRGSICGSVADFTSFSFHAVKNLTTAEGGALTWRKIPGIDDDYIYRQFMLFSLHGQSKDALSKIRPGAWEYDIVWPAYKCNMTDIMAAIGLIQLNRYPLLLKRRREIIYKYDETLESMGIKVLKHYSANHFSSGHLYLTRIPCIDEHKRNEFIMNMAKLGISTNVHYKPLPMMSAYKNLGFQIEEYPNSYNQYCNEITLPLHTRLTDEDVTYILNNFRKCLDKQVG